MKHAPVLAALILLGMMLLPMAYPQTTTAAETTFCKWPTPWPRQVKYFLRTGGTYGFTSAQATRVSYGANTWSEAHFNLSFARVSTLSQATGSSTVYKGDVFAPYESLAETYVYDSYNNWNPNCNRDTGNPIRQVNTVFSRYETWNLDCRADGTCAANNQFDLHHVSAHEFGHWFTMGESYFRGDTMYHEAAPGDWYGRDLAVNDRISAHSMYGCAPGYRWHNYPAYACGP